MSDDTIGGFKFTGGPYLRPFNEYTRRPRTDHLVVHCSDTPAHWNGGAEEIREWHVNDNGWLDIGYHFVIRRNGDIERGRPVWAMGSGVAGHNSNTIHCCLVGGQGPDGKAEKNFTEVQMRALAFLLAALQKYVAPKATILGHRDFPGVTKECPSFDAKAWWYGAVEAESTQMLAHLALDQIVKGAPFLN